MNRLITITRYWMDRECREQFSFRLFNLMVLFSIPYKKWFPSVRLSKSLKACFCCLLVEFYKSDLFWTLWHAGVLQVGFLSLWLFLKSHLNCLTGHIIFFNKWQVNKGEFSTSRRKLSDSTFIAFTHAHQMSDINVAEKVKRYKVEPFLPFAESPSRKKSQRKISNRATFLA